MTTVRQWWDSEMAFLWATIGASMIASREAGIRMLVLPGDFLEVELHLAAVQGEKSPYYSGFTLTDSAWPKDAP